MMAKLLDIDAPETMQLLDLPDDMFFEIGKRLKDPRDLSALAHSCSALHKSGFFKKEIGMAMWQALQLKRHVVRGEEASALSMIQARPYLLFMKAPSVKDISQDWFGNVRTIAPGSVFETLLGMGYTQILHNEHVLRAIIDNAEIAARQFDCQFPDGVDYPFKTYNFDRLVKLVTEDCFINARPYWPLEEETERFIDFFKHVNTGKGWYFDLRVLEHVGQIYAEHEGIHWLKRRQGGYWGNRIFGYLQTLVTAFDAHIINFGLGDVLLTAERFRDAIPARLVKTGSLQAGSSYYPTRPGQTSGVGIDSYIDVLGKDCSARNGTVFSHKYTNLSGVAGSPNYLQCIQMLCSIKMARVAEIGMLCKVGSRPALKA